MNRREFVKILSAAGVATVAPWPLRTALAASAPYTGQFYISIAAKGGWDVTSFCDPKVNITGQPIINNWATTQGVQKAGNIPYAPFAKNKSFFDKFKNHMLVVNGIDSQTNSHERGVVHNWSGRLAEGFPSFGALAAAAKGPELPLALINNGGYRETAGIIRYTQMNDPNALKNILKPNTMEFDTNQKYFFQDDIDRIEKFQKERLKAKMAETNILPRTSKSMGNLFLARAGSEQLKTFADNLPAELAPDVDENGNYFPTLRQAQLSLLAYKSGLTVSCDLQVFGFDTHENHDMDQSTRLGQLTTTIEYVWDQAKLMGISDKLVVFVTSDFSRTPNYNDGIGKDHWPINSAIFMQENALWANRVIGTTDSGHNALKINPNTLKQDNNGITLFPSHMQDALRRLAQIDQSSSAQRFPLKTDQLDIFNPALG